MPTNDEVLGMDHVRDLIDGYQSTCVLMAAVDLGIFDELASQPKDIGDLALTVGADKNSLKRLVRALVVYGLVADDREAIALTDAGHLLAERNGLTAQMVMLREQYLHAWTHLGHSARTGKPAFENVFGMSPWEHRRRNPNINAAFNSMVSGAQGIATEAVLGAYDFSRFRSVADIGGGNGYFLAGLLRKHASTMAVLFDLPHVTESAASQLRSAGVANRCRTVAGSFFEAVPSGCDLYILQYVLHDWNDEDCSTILRNCKEAMGAKGKLLIMEKVCPNDGRAAPRRLVLRDLHMMAVLGGRERTLGEYDALLTGVDLFTTAHVPLAAHCPDIIEVESVN